MYWNSRKLFFIGKEIKCWISSQESHPSTPLHHIPILFCWLKWKEGWGFHSVLVYHLYYDHDEHSYLIYKKMVDFMYRLMHIFPVLFFSGIFPHCIFLLNYVHITKILASKCVGYIMLYYLIYSFINIDFKIKNTDKKCIIII